jgi:hypothetical protein
MAIISKINPPTAQPITIPLFIKPPRYELKEIELTHLTVKLTKKNVSLIIFGQLCINVVLITGFNLN